MVGLSTVIGKLARIAKMLEAGPAARLAFATAAESPPVQAAEFSGSAAGQVDTPSPEPVARPVETRSADGPPEADTYAAEVKPETADASASAIERLRASLARRLPHPPI